MSAGFHHDTARIYQFPVGQRRQKFRQRPENMPASVVVLPVSVPYPVVDTSCWYHQEAIVSDDRTPG